MDIGSDARDVSYGNSAESHMHASVNRPEAERAGIFEMLVVAVGGVLSVALTSLGVWKFIELVI